VLPRPRAAPARAWLPEVDTDTAVSPLALPDGLEVEFDGRGAGTGSPADVLDVEFEGRGAGTGSPLDVLDGRGAGTGSPPDGASAGELLLPPPLLPVGVGVGLAEVPGEDEGDVELRVQKKIAPHSPPGTLLASKAARYDALKASDRLAIMLTHGQRWCALPQLAALTDTHGAPCGQLQSKQRHVEPTPLQK